MAGLRYPATRYEPSPLVDLASKEERERLSPSALRAFFNIIERWSVRDEDARQLLGGCSMRAEAECDGAAGHVARPPQRHAPADPLAVQRRRQRACTDCR